MPSDIESELRAGGAMESRDDARAALSTLRERERGIAALKVRVTDLEVELIAAETLMPEAPSRVLADLPRAQAVAIGTALDLVWHLEREQADRARRQGGGTPSDSDAARHEDARRWLESWLDTRVPEERVRAVARIRMGMMLAMLVFIGLAIFVHWVYLLMLVPVVGVNSFMLWSGQDRAWKRLGAQRNFTKSGLKPPSEWEEPAVRARLAELEASPAPGHGSHPAPSPGVGVDERLDAARETRDAALLVSGLGPDDLDDAAVAWLKKLGAAERLRVLLAHARAEVGAANDVAGASRENLYRYLAREGVASGGNADAASLAAAVERLDARSAKGDET